MTVTVVGEAFIDITVPVHSVIRGETYHRDMHETDCARFSNEVAANFIRVRKTGS